MSKDLALDLNTHDLLIENGELLVVDAADQLEQTLKIRLQFFDSEWFLNVNNGLPFYSDILVKNPNIPNIDAIIKAEILDTDGVEELLSWDSVFDNAARTYTIAFKVRTTYGESELNISLFSDKVN